MVARTLKKVKAYNSKINQKGLHAQEYIKKGEVIFENIFVRPSKEDQELGYIVFPLDKYELLEKTSPLKRFGEMYSLVIWENELLILDLDKIPPEDLAKFACNHSCNPNVLPEGVNLVAVRDIQQGEEITIDYDAIEYYDGSDEEFKMECLCGSKECRKLIGGTGCLSQELMDKYGDNFSPYCLYVQKKHGKRK